MTVPSKNTIFGRKKVGGAMCEKQIERCIKNATFSLEMEGFSVDEQTKEWCRRLLNKEITMEEYIAMAKGQVHCT